MAGVSRQSVSAVESGISDPSLRVAIALARAVGLTVEELFGADDPVAPVAVGGELPGYETRAAGHLAVAAAIAAGLANAGIASEPAALAYDLVFVPLAAERFDLVIPAAHASTREVQGLLKVLSSVWLLDQLASLPGYDPARCGERIATLPPRH
jgi:DNA-binding XRE family transcriptional regulator